MKEKDTEREYLEGENKFLWGLRGMTQTAQAHNHILDFIMFGARETNESLECHKIGHMGCERIMPNFLGRAENGLDIYSYTVEFEDGTSKEITNTHAVYYSPVSPLLTKLQQIHTIYPQNPATARIVK